METPFESELPQKNVVLQKEEEPIEPIEKAKEDLPPVQNEEKDSIEIENKEIVKEEKNENPEENEYKIKILEKK